MKSLTKYLIVLNGPTGIGKTNLSLALAEHFQTEIISCDSRQFYKEMSIGTAVPHPDQLARVPHHFVQHLSVHNYYNASMFEIETLELLEKLFQQHDVLFMVGGSGLYINAVCKGIDDLPRIEPAIREDLSERYKNEGLESIRSKLKLLDPDYYHQVDLKNHKRILKALEICIMTGKPYSKFLTRAPKQRNFNVIFLILNRERDELYGQINKRVDTMIGQGLLDEAKNLFPHRGINALNTVGYKELFEHLAGNISLDEAIDLIKRNTRKYARKQITWFRRYAEASWFHPDEQKEIVECIQQRLRMQEK